MTDNAAINAQCKRSVDRFLGIAQSYSALDILAHPSTPSVKSLVIYLKHVPTTKGTAGYADVRAFLERMMSFMALLGIMIQIVVGDQQSFSRMVWLKRMEPESYGSIVPFPGNFHAAVHMLMAIHILWWTALISWLIASTGLS